MAANTTPRYSLTGDISVNNVQTSSAVMAPTLTLAAADYTGVSANNQLIFTAGANGARITGIHFEPVGSNTQSVARIYVNNGATNTTATNNALIDKMTLIATTASSITAEVSLDWSPRGMGVLDLPAGARIYVGLATAVSAGWIPTVIQAGQF